MNMKINLLLILFQASYLSGNSLLSSETEDNDLNIERPCDNFDIYCIQRYLASHSNCKISNRPVPEPMYRGISSTYFPRVNLSAILDGATYSGLSSGDIEEFYINKVTDKLVLAVTFKNVLVSSSKSKFLFFRPAREPIIGKDFASALTVDVTITIIIPNLKNLQLQRAEVYSFSNSPVTPFAAGPGIIAIPEPQVTLTVAELFANMPLDYAENLLTEGPFYILTYIQYTLCDFGLEAL